MASAKGPLFVFINNSSRNVSSLFNCGWVFLFSVLCIPNVIEITNEQRGIHYISREKTNCFTSVFYTQPSKKGYEQARARTEKQDRGRLFLSEKRLV